MFVSFSLSICSYSFSTSSSALLSAASASFTSPLSACTRSLSAPKRATSLSRHWWADWSSPVRRHDKIKFSYFIQSSGFSGAENKALRGDEDTEAGELRSTAGACWESASAEAGGSWVGGWSNDGAIDSQLAVFGWGGGGLFGRCCRRCKNVERRRMISYLESVQRAACSTRQFHESSKSSPDESAHPPLLMNVTGVQSYPGRTRSGWAVPSAVEPVGPVGVHDPSLLR